MLPEDSCDAYDYVLPPERIAQEPAPRRREARLLSVGVYPGDPVLTDLSFADFPGLLRRGDLLVVNDTRVLPGRLFGARTRTGGHAEVLLLGPAPRGGFEILLRTRGKPRPEETLTLAEGALELRLEEALGAGAWRVMAERSLEEVISVLERHGALPLPPYIAREERDPRDAMDRERYQTVFAERPGAAAAPTAGLHLDAEALAEIRGRGVGLARVTLHVGAGTFRPLAGARLDDHRMHAERFEIGPEAAHAVLETRERGGRVVAVGTTSVRTLETWARSGSPADGLAGQTDLFLRPPESFRVVDALLTNFHAPRSTLLVLMAAYAGLEAVRRAYAHALEKGYRFLSYGDASFWFRPGD